MNTVLPWWVETLVSLLLVASGIFAVLASWGLLQLKSFFKRLHPTALVTTAASWCVTLASVIYFSTVNARLSLSTWLIIIILSISVPITTVLLARAAVFRHRQAGDPRLPQPLLRGRQAQQEQE